MATESDIMQAAAAVYADSLLQLAADAGQADEVGGELADLRKLWDHDADFASLMSSAAIDDDARAVSLKRIFAGRVGALVFNLLMVLNNHRRSAILPQVCEHYRQMLDRRHNREQVHVTTAVPLEEPQREVIRQQILRLTGMQAILVERVDPDLLGGVRIQVGDRIYDSSVQRRLRDIRNELMTSVSKYLLRGKAAFVSEG